MHSRRGASAVQRVPTLRSGRRASDGAARTVETVRISAPFFSWRHLFSPLAVWRLLGNLTCSSTVTVSVTEWAPRQNERSLHRALDSLRAMYAKKMELAMMMTMSEQNIQAKKRIAKTRSAASAPNRVSTRWFSPGSAVFFSSACPPVLSTARRRVFVPIAPTDSPASHWYAQQVARSLIDFDAARRLCADESLASRGAFIVGCVAAAGDRWPAAELLSLLPHDERAAAVAQLLSLRSVYRHVGEQCGTGVEHARKDHEEEEEAVKKNKKNKTNEEEEEKTRGKEEEEEKLVEAVLCDPSATVEDVWTIFRVSIDHRDAFPAPRWACRAAKHIISHSDRATPSRLVAALSVLERAPNERREALAAQCEAVGLMFEAAAYRSYTSGPPIDRGEAMTRARQMHERECAVRAQERELSEPHGAKGFGTDMAALLTQLRETPRPADALVELEKLRKDMSPVVSAHAMRRAALSLARREWEQTSVEKKTPSTELRTNATALEYISKAQCVSLPIAAHRLHVVMGLGSASTARVLLPSCEGRLDRIALLMQRTRCAGISLTLDALQCALHAAPKGEYYVILRLLRGNGARMLISISQERACAAAGFSSASALLHAAENKMRQARDDAALDALRVATHMSPSSRTHENKHDRLQRCLAAVEKTIGERNVWDASCVVSMPLSALRRLLAAVAVVSDAAELSPRVDVIARSSLRRRVFVWSSYSYSSSSYSSYSSLCVPPSSASRGPKGPFPLAVFLYRRAAIGLAHLALFASESADCAAERHAAVRLAACAPEIARDFRFRQTLLRAVGALTRRASGSKTQRQQQQQQKKDQPEEEEEGPEPAQTCVAPRRFLYLQRRENAELVATLACVAGALVARGCWADALRILPPAAKDMPPLLRAARLRAMRRSAEFRAHAEMLMEAEMPLRAKMPRRIRSVVVAAKLEKEFEWWR